MAPAYSSHMHARQRYSAGLSDGIAAGGAEAQVRSGVQRCVTTTMFIRAEARGRRAETQAHADARMASAAARCGAARGAGVWRAESAACSVRVGVMRDMARGARRRWQARRCASYAREAGAAGRQERAQ